MGSACSTGEAVPVIDTCSRPTRTSATTSAPAAPAVVQAADSNGPAETEKKKVREVVNFMSLIVSFVRSHFRSQTNIQLYWLASYENSLSNKNKIKSSFYHNTLLCSISVRYCVLPLVCTHSSISCYYLFSLSLFPA